MDFLLQIAIITLVAGGVGHYLVHNGDAHPLLAVVGAFLCVGAVGGVVIVGFMCSALVFNFVSKYTFDLLGYIVAAPVLLGPLWFMYRMLSGSKREYDGRGFGDGSGGM